MDIYGEQKFSELGEEDFNDILEQDVFPPVSASAVVRIKINLKIVFIFILMKIMIVKYQKILLNYERFV